MEGGKPTFSLPLNCTPSDLATSRDGNFVFATCLSSDEVIALDTQSGLVRNRIAVGSRPFHLTWSPDGKTLLVSNRYSNFLTPIDSSALVAGPKIDLPGRGGVVSVAQGPQNSFWVFVGDSASSDVYILQAKNSPEGLTTEYIRTLKALPGISGLWFNPAAGRQGELWFISRTENKAGVIDIATNTVRTTIDLGEKPIDMVAVNQELFVVSAASHRLDVIEIPTGQLKTPIFLADDVFPSGLVLANDGRTAYIPSANSKKITVIDLDLQQVVKSLDMATPSIAATLVQPGLSAMDTQANATTGAQMPEESIESVRPDGEQATPAASPDLKANQKKPWFRWTW
jgi:DNA-binding beta-propeller fold protein YncE